MRHRSLWLALVFLALLAALPAASAVLRARPIMVGWHDELNDDALWTPFRPPHAAEKLTPRYGAMRLRIPETVAQQTAPPFYWVTVHRTAEVDLDRYPVLAVRTLRLSEDTWWDCMVQEVRDGQLIGSEHKTPSLRKPGLMLYDLPKETGLTGQKQVRLRLNVARVQPGGRAEYAYVRFVSRKDAEVLRRYPGLQEVRLAAPRSSTAPRPLRLDWQKEFPGASTVWIAAAGEGQAVLQAHYPSAPEGTAWKGRLFCLELASGRERWRSEAPAGRNSTVEGGRLYANGPTELLALDWASGQRLWSTPAHGKVLYPLLVGEGRVVYRAQDGAVVAADGATGQELWRRTPPREHDRLLPLAFALGRLYMQTTAADGHSLTAINPVSGRTEQEVRLERNDDLDYLITRLLWSPEQRRFFLEDVKEGAGIDFRSIQVLHPDLKEAWKREHFGRFALVEGVLVCQAWKNVHNERDGLAALDAGSGRVLWRRGEARQREESIVGVLGNAVVIGQGNRTLRGLQPRSGQVVWSLSRPFTEAQVHGEKLLVFSEGKAGRPARVSAYALP